MINIYLKSAVQNLDVHIMKLQEIRNQLAGGIAGPEIGKDVFAPAGAEALPVQTLEPAPAEAPARQARSIKKAMRKQNGGGRKVSTKVSEQDPELGTTGAALTPMSPEMLAAGRKLAEPFGARDLETATGCVWKQASNAITRWLINGFIKRTEPGKYRRLAKFPGAVKRLLKVPLLKSRSGEREVVVTQETNPSATKEVKSAAVPAAAENGVSQQQRPAVATAREDSRPTGAGGLPAVPGAAEKLTPYSASGIAIGRQLKAVFTMEELSGLLPQGKQQAYYFVSQWRNKDWITKEDFDIYRKAAGFGG